MSDAEDIDAWLATHAVTHCPTKYLLPSTKGEDAASATAAIPKRQRWRGGTRFLMKPRKTTGSRTPPHIAGRG